MIQRIQSIYLLVVVALLITMIFAPIATVDITSAAEGLKLSPLATGSEMQDALLQATYSSYLLLLTALAAILAAVAIFLFKNRLLQIRLCGANLAILLGLQIFAGFSIYKAEGYVTFLSQSAQNSAGSVSYSIIAIFPAIALILCYLALRAITKDELLVRSLDRIR